MNRRAFLSTLVAIAALGGPARAEVPVERILRDLRRLGYDRISVERTLLRRTRILAVSREAQREIIVNPNTGEILRDLWIPVERSGTSGTSGSLLDGDNSGSGSGGDDDDDDDDDDDGDGDDDSRDDGGEGRGRGRGGDDGDDGDDD
ncbi:MAG: hypothetical protein ACT4OK_00100 [Gemmobacter sp.]